MANFILIESGLNEIEKDQRGYFESSRNLISGRMYATE